MEEVKVTTPTPADEAVEVTEEATEEIVAEETPVSEEAPAAEETPVA